MKRLRLTVLLLLIALLLAVPIAWWSLREEADFGGADPEKLEDWGMDRPTFENKDVPPTANEGEVVLHFPRRAGYRAYSRSLYENGRQPLGQIDALNALRLERETFMAARRPVEFDARATYVYRVELPSSPTETQTSAMAGLRPHNRSAREIVDRDVGGNGNGILIGIVDSGIHAHPQFDDLYIVRIDLVGGDIDGPGAEHGTSVASIAAGTEGVVSKAELLVVRALNNQGAGNSFDVAKGIVEAVKLGADVINVSATLYEDSLLLRRALRYARFKDVVLVAPAGNDGHARLPYPAAYPQVLSATAVDADERHAPFCNTSDALDFALPGIGIRTARGKSGTGLFHGSAAAAPLLTGTLAALLSDEAGRTPEQAIDLMREHLDDAGAPGKDPRFGAGIVNWNRIRERGETRILDLALAGIHLKPVARPGGEATVQVTVQNRGTQWASGAELEIHAGPREEPVRLALETLGPRLTATREIAIRLPENEAGGSVDVRARVIPENPDQDIRPENNVKSRFLQLGDESPESDRGM